MGPTEFAERLQREADEFSKTRQLRKARAYRAAARKALEWVKQKNAGSNRARDRLFGPLFGPDSPGD